MKQIIPIKRANTLSRYYIISYKKKIPFKIRLLRFLVRYTLPTIVIASVMILADIYLFSQTESIDHLLFILMIGAMSFTATIISRIWFGFISDNEDKEEDV